MTDFRPADVGREIVASGGLGVVTAYVSATEVTVEILQPFPATSFDSGAWQLLGSPRATLTPSAKDPVGSTVTLTLSIGGWRPADVGKYVRVNGGLCRITSLDGANPTTIANAVLESELTAVVAAPPLAWTLESSMWGGAFGYPRCGTIFEQRLWPAGSPGFPQTVWGSAIGAYYDFTIGTLDDEAIAYTIGNGESNPILNMTSSRGLLPLTGTAEFSMKGGQERAITPTNVQVRDQSTYGSAPIPPARAGNEVFFVQRGNRKVRALSLNQYDSEQYVAPDVATLSEHITAPGLVEIAFQAEPDALLYAVRSDGQLPTLTADREQDVFAWSRQVTQGAFESVAVVPSPAGNRVFFVVARTIDGQTTRYIEMLDETLDTDCAITGTSEAGATVWSGLDHLKGRTIYAKGDGVFLGEFVVSAAGEVTLPRAAFAVEFGLAYISAVKTLTPEFMAGNGPSSGAQLSIHETKIRLLETTGCRVNLQEVPFRQYGLNVLDRPPPLFTGDKKAGSLGWGDGAAQTLVQQTLPYRFHLLSIISRMTANEA